MPDWLEWVIGGVVGFLFGRAGSAVDHEMKTQHGIRTAVPALTAGVQAINQTLASIDGRLGDLARADMELRDEIRTMQRETNRRVERLEGRIDCLDDRFDAFSASERIPYHRRQAIDPQLPGPVLCPPGSRSDCVADHWVPPLDRPGWGDPPRQTEDDVEPPDDGAPDLPPG